VAVINYSLSQLKMFGVIWLNAGGQLMPFLLDVVQGRLSWELNGIPTAKVTLACGREVTTGLPANIHYLIDYLRMQLPFQLYVSAKEFSNSYGVPIEPWPNQPFLVFEGYTAASGMTKSASGQIEYSLDLVHWLADMDYSSGLSRTVHPLNANALSNSASVFGGFGLSPSFVSSTSGDSFFTSPVIQRDFWGQALKPWLLQVCRQNILTDPNDPILPPPGQQGSNYEAIRALARFEPLTFAGPKGQPVQLYRYGVPLSLNAQQLADLPFVSLAIADDVSTETFQSMAATTLWSKLLGGYGSSYLFSVVPMVQSAIVVPFTPGIRGTWQVIYAEEYQAMASGASADRAIRGVRLYGGLGDETGAFGGKLGEAGAQDTIGGAFTNPFMGDGMIRYANAPRWMSSINNPDSYGRESMQPGGFMGNAFFPGAGPALRLPRPMAIRRKAQSVLNLYAQFVYVNEVTQNRSLSVSGRLRFDIGPGSSVQVMLSEEKFVERSLGQVGQNSVFGSVRRLTHTLDAATCQAGTTFDIGWIRTPIENTLDGTSVPGSPLWGTPWYGCPNVEGFNPFPIGQLLGWGLPR
jgi:hypothetical protein